MVSSLESERIIYRKKLLDWYPLVMVVRIRFGKGPTVSRKRGKNQRMALAMAALLTPAALTAGVLALWRIAADLNWTKGFAIPTGIFSHWQVWLGGAVALQLCSRFLNRYGKGGGQRASGIGKAF
jgi:hypothetical protein